MKYSRKGFCLWTVIVSLLLALFAGVSLVGCAQNTETPTVQRTEQVQKPVTEQAAQGANIKVVNQFFNVPVRAPGEELTDDQPGLDEGEYATSRPSTEEVVSSATGNSVLHSKAGYTQNGWTVNQTIYGSSTGAQTGGAAGPMTGAATVTPTVSAEQKPETQVNPALAFGMPGSAPNAATSNTWGANSPASLTNTPSQSASAVYQTLLQKACGGAPADVQAFLQYAAQMFGLPFPTTAPAVPPAK